ncbi:MAG: carbon-nitrogen hydrolase family protein [Candidatus Hydrogenedentes bacterium]|nr:carbon-nitrogen hydrolase family protein [Candidatus Hydrogenedentota bacterium]
MDSEQKTTLRLALMRGEPTKWDLAGNFATFLRLIRDAAQGGADVFITPECWLDGYAAADKESSPERLRSVAQDLETSPYISHVSHEARDRKMHVCFGFTSLEKGEVLNAAGLWSPSGELIGIYHKTHLQRHDLQFARGSALPVWPTPWGPVGIMICADRRWPETARCLRLQGARLILNPTYGFSGDLNEAMMRTRAYENQCFIAFAHPRTGLVTDPSGAVIAKAEGEAPAVLFCDVDLSQAKDNNHLKDRRPDLYGAIVEQPGKRTPNGK